VPALREHREEIGRLVGMFLLSRLADGPKPAPKVYFTLGAARALVTYEWPYNVRELRQCIDSAFMAAVSEMDEDGFCAIKQRHLPFASFARCAPARGPMASTFELQEVTDASILSALRTAGGNRSEAARLLGISERTVFRRLRKLRQASSG
jgi:two-component system, NtrC family, response regulator HydG